MPEREVKLAAPADFVLPDLTGVLPGAVVNVLSPRRLNATYWDTADLKLARCGASLRYRDEGEDGSTWTVKLPSSGATIGLARREMEFEGSPDAVPPAARSLLTAYSRRASLSPVAVLDSRRVRLELRDASGGAIAEVDDDQVSVVDQGRVVDRFREVEVELAPAVPEIVARSIVERLHKAGADVAEQRAKVARALGPMAVSAPDVIRRNDVPTGASAGEWVAAALSRSVAALIEHDPGVRLGDDPEELHQARVAVRRLRSDLRTFEALLDPGWAEGIRAGLAWVAGPFGATRDADVLLQRLWHHVGLLRPADAEAAGHLLELLASSRVKVRTAMIEMMCGARYLDLIEALVEAVRDPHLSETAEAPASRVAPLLAGDTWRRLRKAARAARRAEAAGDVEADLYLHRVRIAAKRCRYGCDAASLVVGDPARRMARGLARMQDILGEFQDAVVAEDWLRSMATGPLRLDQAVVVGELISYQRASAIDCHRRWPSAWRKLRRPETIAWMR